MSGMEALAVPALIGATAVGTGTSIYGQQMAGREAQRSAEFEAQQFERQAQQYETRAAQEESARRRDLVSSLDTIEAIRSGRGLMLDSPTGRAIQAGAIDDAERGIATAKANAYEGAARSELAASETRRKGRSSLLAADIGSLTTAASGIGKIATAGRYPITK